MGSSSSTLNQCKYHLGNITNSMIIDHVLTLSGDFEKYQKLLSDKKINGNNLDIRSSVEINDFIKKVGINNIDHQKVLSKEIKALQQMNNMISNNYKDGLKFNAIQKFIKKCGGISELKNKTVYEVFKMYIKPILIVSSYPTYCEYLKSANHYMNKDVHEATVYIKNLHNYTFLDAINAMKIEYKDNIDNIYIWFDLFSCDSYEKRIEIYELQGIASSLIKQNKYEEALIPYRSILNKSITVYGMQSEKVGHIYSWIAYLYQCQMNYMEALQYDYRALEICKNILGKNDLYVATILNNIASIYYHQHEYIKAIEYYEECKNIRIKKLHNQHPDIAGIYNNLSAVYEIQGNYQESLQGYQIALKIYSKRLSKFNFHVAMINFNLGNVYQKLNEFQLSLQFYEQALNIYSKHLPEDHKNISTIYTSIAYVYYRQMMYKENELSNTQIA